MDIGPNRQTISIGILRRKTYALICCNIFLLITKFCYGKMTIQTCIHTTCPSITKSAIEVIPRRRNAKIRSKPERKIWNLLCFGIRNLHRQNPESTAWNPESNTVLDYLTWGESKLNTWICVVFKMLVDVSQRYTRGFEAICDLIGV